MKLAIMQPYFFPYVGYFQLANAVDEFVVYDDVQFVKGGWVNRNFILSRGEAARLTLNLEGASSNRRINQIGVGDNRQKLLKTIRQEYSRAPCFDSAYPIVEEIVMQRESNLAVFLEYQIRRLCKYMGVEPKWHRSSALDKDCSLTGEDKVLNICNRLGADTYINLPGGKHLYSREKFRGNGLDLSFINPGDVEYKQFGNDFVPNLSIIDLIMFNAPKQCRELLEECSIE